MRKTIVLLLLVLVVVFPACAPNDVPAHSFGLSELSEKELRSYANEHNTWVLCYQQGKRVGEYISCDATKDYIYFSYMEHNCVDVYNTRGAFLYSFLFPDRQNGVVYVRCENNRVFIRTKSGIVYIFDGTEEIGCMDSDEASEKGFDFYWFYNHQPFIKVNSQWISRLDADGAVIEQIPTPPEIRQTMPISLAGLGILVNPAVMILLFFAITYYFAFRRKQ